MKLGRLIPLCALSAILTLPALAQYATGNPKAKPGQAEDEPEREISGITIERKNGDGFLGIEITGGNFKLSFYDKEKQRVQADRPRALLRWPVKYRSADERLVLNKGGDGTFLTSARVIRPPHNFRLFITMLSNEGDKEESDPVTYVINFSQ